MLADAEAAVFVACNAGDDGCRQVYRLDPDFPQAEREAGGQTVADRSGEHSRGVGPGALSKWRLLVENNRRQALSISERRHELVAAHKAKIHLVVACFRHIYLLDSLRILITHRPVE